MIKLIKLVFIYKQFFLNLIKKGNYYNDFKNILSTYKLIKNFDR